MSVRSIVFVKSALFFEKRLALEQGQLPSRGVGTAAEGLLYSDAAFANAGIGTKGGTLD